MGTVVNIADKRRERELEEHIEDPVDIFERDRIRARKRKRQEARERLAHNERVLKKLKLKGG